MKVFIRGLSLVVVVGLICSAVGCGPSDPSAKMMADANSSKHKQLANLYSRYQSQNGWKGPEDEKVFTEFIDGLPQTMKDKMLVKSSAADLLVSDRDGQKFKIRYGVQGAMGQSIPVIFEQEGVDGVRMVGFTLLKEEEVSDDARYNDLWEGKAGVQGMDRKGDSKK